MRPTTQLGQHNQTIHPGDSSTDEDHKSKRQKTSGSAHATALPTAVFAPQDREAAAANEETTQGGTSTDPMPIDHAAPPTAEEPSLRTSLQQIPITNATILELTLPAASGPPSRPSGPDAASLNTLKTLLLHSRSISLGYEHVFMHACAERQADNQRFDRHKLPCHALLAAQLSPRYFENDNAPKVCKAVVRSFSIGSLTFSPEVRAQTFCDAIALNKVDDSRVARYLNDLSALTEEHKLLKPYAARIQQYLEAELLLQEGDAPMPTDLVDALLDMLPGEGEDWTATSVSVLMLLSHAGPRISDRQSRATCEHLTRFLAFVSLLPVMGDVNPRSFWLDLMSGSLLLQAWTPLTAEQKRSLLNDLPNAQISASTDPLLQEYVAARSIPFPDRLGFLQRLGLSGHNIDGAAKALAAAFDELAGSEQREILLKTAYVDKVTLPLIKAFATNASVAPEERIDVLRLFAQQPVPRDTRELLNGLLADLREALEESL